MKPCDAIMSAIREGYGMRASIQREAEWILALDPERGCIQRRGRTWEQARACAGGR